MFCPLTHVWMLTSESRLPVSDSVESRTRAGAEGSCGAWYWCLLVLDDSRDQVWGGNYTPGTINTCRLWGTDWTTTTDTETERNVFQAPRRSPVSYDQPLQITWPGPMRTFTDHGLTSSSAAVNTDSNQHRRLHHFFFSSVHVVTHGQSLSFTHACIYKHFSSTDTISRKKKKNGIKNHRHVGSTERWNLCHSVLRLRRCCRNT